MKKHKVVNEEFHDDNQLKESGKEKKQKDVNGHEDDQKIEKEEPDSEMQFKNEISALNDKYLRLAAEFDNYRRRTLKERQELILTAGEEIITGILPILDDFERANEMLQKTEGGNLSIIEGIELIYSKLFSYLTSKGLKIIEAVGKELDTDFHEAVALVQADESKKKNIIVDVVQNGYTLNGKVIRFAKVVVAQ